MGWVAGLLIGLLILAGAFLVLARTYLFIADGCNAIVDSLLAAVGRQALNFKVFVPPQLAVGYVQPFDNQERQALIQYAPPMDCDDRVRIVQYKEYASEFYKAVSPTSISVNTGNLQAILEVSAELPYTGLFGKLDQQPTYPVAEPSYPRQIRKPPTWTKSTFEVEDPKFELPYYSGWRSFLNKYVDLAYGSEVTKLKQALELKQSRLAKCDRWNEEMGGLEKRAQMKYETAIDVHRNHCSTQKSAYDSNLAQYLRAAKAEQDRLLRWRERSNIKDENGLDERIDLALHTMLLPSFLSREGTSKVDQDSEVLIHEHQFPDLAELEFIKYVELKGGLTPKPANQKEKKDAALKIYPSFCLRLAVELARLDTDNLVKAVVVNGWSDYTEKSTGQIKRAYCASLFATKEQLKGLNLNAVDPETAFNTLKGVVARTMELTPIAPVMRLDTNDSRFVDPKEVIDHLANGENLASMPWEDFEHLCRELFERAFASSGAEVKITQASRDQGVDAIVFDPDPLRGGKIVIQAKRYTNTVDVAAVRDLYGSVMNEGAIKGILVTTSHLGPDAYSFAKDKPLTLINGNELLGLLEKHGYKFRIDLAEAKQRAMVR